MNTETPPIERLESGVDWITVTSKGSALERKGLETNAYHIQQVQRAVTCEQVHDWQWKGYEGWRISGLSYGKRPDSDIIMASGVLASKYWKLVMRNSTNVSRIDLQTTVLFGRPLPDLVLEYYDMLEGNSSRKVTMVRNNGDGQTLYVGSRTSDQMGRIYDKGIESKTNLPPGMIWRYEVEYKQARAKAMAGQLLIDVCHRSPAHKVIPTTIWHWFTGRGVTPPYGVTQDIYPIIISLEAEETEPERQLKWLHAQVRPTVQRLLTSHQRQTILALGLDELLKMD